MNGLEVVPAGPVTGLVAAPASKSLTNRLLAVAALARGTSRLKGPLHSDDSVAMRAAVAALGAAVDSGAGEWAVRGTGGRIVVPAGVVDARLSGTTARFATALAALAPGPVTVDGLPPLRRRPMGPLVQALAVLGADVAGDRLPVRCGGGLRGGEAVVDASGSSQFASAVLLVAPYADTDVTVRVTGHTAVGYVTLTVEVMVAWGADVAPLDPGGRPGGAGGWRVRAGTPYTARDVTVEADLSAANHLYALAVATGGAVTVTNHPGATSQPDGALAGVLQRMGATVRAGGDGLTVARSGPLAALPEGVDLAAMPDMVPVVAVLAALAGGTTVITGAAVTRGHETDRLAALAAELGKVGVAVQERPDGLVVHGGTAAGPARLQTYDDHRLAMAFAALGAAVPGVTVDDPGCVAKTYPRFWDDLRALGGRWRAVP